MNKIVFEKLHNHDNDRTKELLRLAQNGDYEVCIWGCGLVGTTVGRRILDLYNITPSYYCDSNKSLIGKEITSGIFCRDSKHLIDNSERTICFLMVGLPTVFSAYLDVMQKGIVNIVTYDDLLELNEVFSKLIPFKGKKDIAIYTCITDDYDELREPEFISDRCDYYVVSENKPLTSRYRWIDAEEYLPNDFYNYTNDDALIPILKNRYYKMFPNVLFPQYRYSIYLDGNLTIIGDISVCTEKLKKARIGLASSNYTDNPYIQIFKSWENHNDDQNICMLQMGKYINEGMPSNVGNFMCNVIVREHNNPICLSIMSTWWEEFISYAKRDQNSMPYALWKNGFTKEDVYLICDDIKADTWYGNPYWRLDFQHRKERFNKIIMRRENEKEEIHE